MTANANPTLTRAALADAIEAAIAALDVIDGEPDLEPDNEDGCYAEDNPLIGKPDPYVRGGELEDDEPSLCGLTVDPWHLRKHHDDGDREGEDSDDEPDLGSIGAGEPWRSQMSWWRGRDGEPDLAAPNQDDWDDQSRWAIGGHDNREHETDDFEHSLGFGNPTPRTNQTHYTFNTDDREDSGDSEPTLGSRSCVGACWGLPVGCEEINQGPWQQTNWAADGDVGEREPDDDYEDDGNHEAWFHPPEMPLVWRDCVQFAWLQGQRYQADELPAEWVAAGGWTLPGA